MGFPPVRTFEEEKEILIEVAKDSLKAVSKKYKISPNTLMQWKKLFSTEELAEMGFPPVRIKTLEGKIQKDLNR